MRPALFGVGELGRAGTALIERVDVKRRVHDRQSGSRSTPSRRRWSCPCAAESTSHRFRTRIRNSSCGCLSPSRPDTAGRRNCRRPRPPWPAQRRRTMPAAHSALMPSSSVPPLGCRLPNGRTPATPRSMLFRDSGRVHRRRTVSPAGSQVGTQRSDLCIVQTDAEFKPAHLRPRALAGRLFVSPVQDDVDEGGRIRCLQSGIAGERRCRFRRVCTGSASDSRGRSANDSRRNAWCRRFRRHAVRPQQAWRPRLALREADS